MDPAKVSAVAEWPTPDSCKKVQQFLGFAHFYRRFIRGFSAIAAPLHTLTSPRVRFNRSPEAEEAFQTLKRRFTSAPILTLPDPQRQFVVEVDASGSGRGVHRGMFGLWSQQAILRVTHGTPATSAHPFQTVVRHFYGLRHGAPGFKR